MNLLSGLNKKISRNSITRETGKLRLDSWVYWSSNTDTDRCSWCHFYLFIYSWQATHCIIVLWACSGIWQEKYTQTCSVFQFFFTSLQRQRDIVTIQHMYLLLLLSLPPFPLPPLLSSPPSLFLPFSLSPSLYDDWQYREYTSGTFITLLGSQSLSSTSSRISYPGL